MAVTNSDVEALSKTGWRNLPDSKKTAMREIAEREVNQLYEGKTSTVPIQEGDRDDLIRYIAAHKWEQAEGGEAQSESAGGGNITYNTVTGEVFNNLSETRYGRAALEYLGDEQSTGVVTTF